jgi:hypothetical protein
MVGQMIANATLKKLSDDPFLGAPDGVWAQERRFDLARHLLGRGSLFHGGLPAEEVRARAEEIFEAVGRDRNAQISLRVSASYSGAELEDLVARIAATGLVQVVSPLPEGDVLHPTSGWVWDFYSPQRLMEFEVEVYGNACEAYDEAMAHSFARLGWSMPSSALAPFGVILEIEFERGVRLGNIPGLTAMRVPMALMPQLVPSGQKAIWSASKRAVVTQTTSERGQDWERHSETVARIRSWLADHNREPIGALGWTSTGADDMSKVRPASSMAAHWLWDDLKSLGLGSGTFPQLR